MGGLPSARMGIRATKADGNTIFVTGGNNGYDANYLTSILSWDPIAETWEPAGNLALARSYHAALARHLHVNS